MQATATSLQSTAEVGVDTGPIISLFLKLKAGFQAKGTVEDAVKTMGTDDQRLSLLAVAEATLQDAGRLTSDPAHDPPAEYFRFYNVFSGYAPGQQTELIAALGPDVGQVVLDRWAADDKLFSDAFQFAYGTVVPRAMAAILIIPPNPARRIAGDSSAPYPPFGNRVFFGRFGAVQNGVRFVNTMYYVADGDMPLE